MHQTPNYNIDPKNTLLLIIDPQKAFGIRSAPVQVPHVESALTNMSRAGIAWEMYGGQTIVTQHGYDGSLEVGRVQDFLPKIGQMMSLYNDSEWTEFHYTQFDFNRHMTLKKTEFNALASFKFNQILRRMGIITLVICGLTTPICVEGTVRGAHEHGFKVVVLEDACASQAMGEETAQQAHASAIGRMGYVFAQIMKTDEFINHLSI